MSPSEVSRSALIASSDLSLGVDARRKRTQKNEEEEERQLKEGRRKQRVAWQGLWIID